MTLETLEQIVNEINNTTRRRKKGDFGPPYKQFSHKNRLVILAEEIGEIAKEIKKLEGFKKGSVYPLTDIERAVTIRLLRSELIQAASISILWIEDLEEIEDYG